MKNSAMCAWLTLLLMMGSGSVGLAMPDSATSATSHLINVHDHGAVGDGVTDDTPAFQKALDTAEANGGGCTVFAPKGNYLFKGHLSIPNEVTLEGVWTIPLPSRI